MNGSGLLLLCLVARLSSVCLADSVCSGKVNTNPILREDPRFVSTVANGKRYVVGSGYDQINILHVYGGTPYDMGLALGKLMSKEISQLVPEYFNYLYEQVEQILKIVPPVSLTTFLYHHRFSYASYSSSQNGLLI